MNLTSKESPFLEGTLGFLVSPRTGLLEIEGASNASKFHAFPSEYGDRQPQSAVSSQLTLSSHNINFPLGRRAPVLFSSVFELHVSAQHKLPMARRCPRSVASIAVEAARSTLLCPTLLGCPPSRMSSAGILVQPPCHRRAGNR